MLIERYNYSEEETEGRLYLNEDEDDYLYTLERPWLPGLPGGMPRESCVPDGTYALVRHARPNGDVVCALRNPALGVYYSRENVPPEGGRTLILIHAANYVDQIQGCVAVGLSRTIYTDRRMVGSSRLAMQRVMRAFDDGDHELTIRAALGTDDA